jgi:non-specific protein-tyrosine kinase
MELKLSKAMAKAKKGRKPNKKAGEILPRPAGKKTADNKWTPPVYSDSGHVELDPNTVYENRCVCIAPDAPELDLYKVLRTKIQHLSQVEGLNTLMITSPQPGEGKTLTSINLALTFSMAYNQTVLLVDCDFRRQGIHKTLGFDKDLNLIDYLVDERPLSDLIVWPGIDKLTLISGNRTIDSSAELLGSPRMQTLMEELKSRYPDRYVLLDTAPLLGGADAMALTPYVDIIIMVIEQGRTSMRDVQKAVEMIPREKFLGFVMNRQKISSRKRYGYYHYYR